MEQLNYKPEGKVYIGAEVTLPDATRGIVEDLWYKHDTYMAQVNGRAYPVNQLRLV